MRRIPMPKPVAECRMCQDHSAAGLCGGHIIDAIDNQEQLLGIVLGWLNVRCSTHEERTKARRVLMRNLMHPESGADPQYGEQYLKPTQQRPRGEPYIESPMCVCGARRSRHDPMTGLCETSACNGFFPVPS
jgi:hypothetical protein